MRSTKSAESTHRGTSLNCCGIEDLEPALKECGSKVNRIIAVYPNASSRPHHELDGSDGIVGLKDNFRTALYLNYLAHRYNLKIIGGCCGYTAEDIATISFVVRSGLFSNQVPETDRGLQLVA